MDTFALAVPWTPSPWPCRGHLRPARAVDTFAQPVPVATLAVFSGRAGVALALAHGSAARWHRRSSGGSMRCSIAVVVRGQPVGIGPGGYRVCVDGGVGEPVDVVEKPVTDVLGYVVGL